MKKNMPLEGLRWSRDSGSALYDTPQTAVLGRAGGGNLSDIHIVTSLLSSTFYQFTPPKVQQYFETRKKIGEKF